MIISTGVDLAEVDRIRAAIEHPRIGQRFRDRVFTKSEIAYCEKKQRGKYESYAGRFATKEAVMKALGVQSQTLGLMSAGFLSSYRMPLSYLMSVNILLFWIVAMGVLLTATKVGYVFYKKLTF